MPDSQTLKVLFFGDIVGKPGRKAVAKIIPELKKNYRPDLIMANAENLAHGIGVTQKTLNEVINTGVDFFTSGNHVWGKPDVYKILEDPDAPLIRPANYPDNSPGQGQKILQVGDKSILVINLHGKVFIQEELACPFHTIDKLLAQYKNDKLAGIIVDFHAEATSEKVAFGWHANGRVSAVLGTHTHVPTADETILPGGTAYQTDIGMIGLKESVIGIDKDIIINNFLSDQTKAHDIPDKGLCAVNVTLISIDTNTRRAIDITRIHKEIDV